MAPGGGSIRLGFTHLALETLPDECAVICTLLRDFSRHGEKAIAKVRQTQPAAYLPKRAGRLLHATGARLKEFDSILVAPERRSPEYLQKSIQGEIEKWATLIKAANIEAE